MSGRISPAGRLGDRSHTPADAHGCPTCPHPATGPSVSGSGNVLINNRAALRVGDVGVHDHCCGENSWLAIDGAASVLINGKAAHRALDPVEHCGGPGHLVDGSHDVVVGDWSHPSSGRERLDYEMGFLLRCSETGVPVPNFRYRLVLADGTVLRGITDPEGRTRLVIRSGPEIVRLEPDDASD